MAREETTEVIYETSIRQGIREAAKDGTIYEPDLTDEPFAIALVRHTVTKVRDGRGRNWSAGTDEHETIATLSPTQAADLAKFIVNDLAYMIEVAERRVLTTAKEAS